MPATALMELGLRRPPGGGPDLINVDLIVGEDGVARAVRLDL